MIRFVRSSILCLSVLALTLVVASVVPSGAFAQSVYLKKDKSSSTIAPNLTPEVTDNTQAPEIRDLQPHASKPSAQQNTIGNHIYTNCMAQDHPILQGNDKELFCGCTSAKSVDVMTPQNIKAMSTDTKDGLEQRNRMLMFVYAPCMSYPTRALILNSCLGKTELKNPVGTCDCLADGMADFIQIKAPQVIQRALRRNSKDLNPMQFLLESPEYQSKQKQVMVTCVSKYEYVR